MPRLMPALALVFFAGTAVAGPLDKRFVPADCTWLVHVDVEAAVSSSIGKIALAHKGEADIHELDDLKAKFGVDPVADIRGLTVFGQKDDGADAVILIIGTPAFDQVVEKMTAQTNTVSETVDGYNLLTWEEDGESHFAHVRKGRDASERLVFVSEDKERLLVGLKTADRKARSIADSKDSPLTGQPSTGSFVFVDAPEVADAIQKARRGIVGHHAAEAGDDSAILEKIRGVQVDVGENTGKLYMSLVLTADSAENATNLMQTAQGFMAMARLMTGGDKDMAELASLVNAVKVSTDDRKMHLKAAYSVEKIQKLMEAAHERDKDADDGDDDQPTQKPEKKQAPQKPKKQSV